MSFEAPTTRPVFVSALHVAIGSATSLVSSVLVTLLATSLFGVTRQTDAYFMALLFPQMIALFMSRSPAIAAIPVLVRSETARGAPSAAHLTSLFLWAVIALLGAAGAVQLLARDLLVAVMAPGFSESARRLTSELMIYTIPATVLGGIVNVLAAILNVRHRYFLPAIAPALVNATVIPILFVAGRDGVHVWAFAYLLGSGMALLVAARATLRAGQPLGPPTVLRHPDARALLTTILPFALIGALGQAAETVVRAVASLMAGGVVSALSIALTVTSIPVGLSAYALGTALVPAFARSVAERDLASTRALFDRGIRGLSILLAPVAASFIVLGEPIVRVVFERGTFDERATLLTSDILRILAVGLVVQPFIVVAHRALLGAGATRLLLVVAVVETTLLSLLAMAGGTYGHVGLASAYLLGTIGSAVLVTVASRQRFDRLELPGAAAVAAHAALYALAGALLGGALLAIARPASLLGTWVWLAAALAVGGGTYLLLLATSRVRGIRDVLLALWSLVRRPAGTPS